MASALREVETRLGAKLSPSQRQFVISQSKKNQLLAEGKKRKRTTAEEALLRSLQNQMMHYKRSMRDFDERLIVKLPVKANAERESLRKKKRTEEQVEKDKTVQRVCMVVQRAGGLTEGRKADVRAGQKKNKDTSVFSGDALKTNEIAGGIFIVEPLTGGRDGLGNLGDIVCSFCGALK